MNTILGNQAAEMILYWKYIRRKRRGVFSLLEVMKLVSLDLTAGNLLLSSEEKGLKENLLSRFSLK